MKKKILLAVTSAALFTGVLGGCDLFKKPDHVHTFETGWTTSATQHWHKATCEHTDEKSELGNHVDDDLNKYCDVCGYDMHPVVPDSTYIVKVYEKTGVKATADVERAKKGDTVTLTISEISTGYTLTAVKMNDVTLTADASNPMVYKFEMPNQSAVITFQLDVTGDITISGDFSAAFVKNTTTGIYEAKGVSVVNDPKEDAVFNVNVGATKLNALDLDETKSFGDISMTSSKTSTFAIRTHNTYDFFYDPEAEEAPFYVQRVGVDTLPSTVDELSSLLITGYAVRSEPAIYSGVTSMNIKIDNIDGKENTDVIHQQYNWKKYANNIAYGKVTDTDSMGDETYKHVYKELDLQNKVFKVVDTYNKKNGTLTANDDPYREDYNKYGAYSAKYNIITGDDYDYRRFSMNETHATRSLNVSAHMPAYLIEREIMDSYRVGFEGSDEMSWCDRQIVSTAGDAGAFTVAVDTKVEYKLVSSSGSDASQAWVFDVDLGFDKRGAMTSISYRKVIYSVDQWDFVNHKAGTGKLPTTVKKINGTYGYDTPTENFTSSIFDITPYFISSIDSIKIFNPATGKEDNGQSCVQLSDKVRLYDGDFDLPETVTFTYSPETALDLWQYGPTSSTDETVIKKMANDLYYTMTAINEGNATITFSNHHTGAAGGATYDLAINVSTNVKIRTFFLFPEDDPYSSITDSTPVNIKAGTVHSYYVNKSPDSAPLKYEAVSSNPAIAAITSLPNSELLRIDFSGAASITSTEIVKITMTSDKYDTSFSGTPIVFTFCIIPADIDPTGKWVLYDYKTDTYEPDTFIEFTSEFVVGSSTEKIGTIHDGGDTNEFFDATFKYIFDGLTLTAKITSISITSRESWSNDPNDYQIHFEYRADIGGGIYAVGLVESVYDEAGEGFVVSPLFGSVDTNGEYVGLAGFKKVEA